MLSSFRNAQTFQNRTSGSEVMSFATNYIRQRQPLSLGKKAPTEYWMECDVMCQNAQSDWVKRQEKEKKLPSPWCFAEEFDLKTRYNAAAAA